MLFFFFKQKTAYEMRISDWSSDVCSSDLAIDYVNDHDRPLGLYYFGQDKSEEERVLTRTISGGVTVNDVLFHNAMEDLPFGGVGPSGMGNYHGIDGFRTFSHARAGYRQQIGRASCRARVCQSV